jgi:sulfite exporter TauE/SafE
MSTTLVADLLAALAAGLFSSLHCVGMCGPLASLGCRAGMAKSSRVFPLLFVAGKFVSYSLLGLAAGFAGAALVGVNSFGKATAVLSLSGGALMLVLLVVSRLPFSARPLARLSAGVARFSLRTRGYAPLLLGGATALLPCGVLYAMVARSAAAGEPLVSMSLMQAFGLGTSPALLGVGTLLRLVPARWSRFGNMLAEVVLALTALLLLWRGIAGLAMTPAHPSCCH